MIDRQNWIDVREFIATQENIQQRDVETLRNFWVTLRHLLEWADSTPLHLAYTKEKPTLPVYLLTNRNDKDYKPNNAGKTLSYAVQAKICANARMFFTWARSEHTRYKPIKQSWLETLQPRKAARDNAKLGKVIAWSLDDILKVVRMPADKLQIERLEGLELESLTSRTSLSLMRSRAAICFMYLSGMRVTAFLSLPVACVDLDQGSIEQNPALGVLTKNRKSAMTSFLPIPEIMEVIKEWDEIVRKDAPKDRRWYCGVNHWGTVLQDDGALSPTKMRGKRNPLVNGMKRVCELAGVPYKSPHKLRHGHAIYGVKHAKTIAELKAVSQNLMHSSIQITDSIYGNLSGYDVRSIIGTLGEVKPVDNGDALTELLKNPAILAFIEVLKRQST